MKSKHLLGLGALLLGLVLPSSASAVDEPPPPEEPVPVMPAGEEPPPVAPAAPARKLTFKVARSSVRETLKIDALRFINWRQGFGRFIKCHRVAKRKMRCRAGWKLGKKRRHIRVKAGARVRLTRNGRVKSSVFILFRGRAIGIAHVGDA